VVLGYFAARQEDREEVLVGPPKAVAYGPDGLPSQAAKGFAKAQGVRADKLKVLITEKGEYVGLKKIKKGKHTQDILKRLVPRIISSLTFPKMMRWEESNFRFSRPIRNIVCLFDGRFLAFCIAGVSSRDFTTGHKINSPQKIKIKSFANYRDALRKNKVMVDQDERKKRILSQIERRLAPLEAQLFPDEDLLEKITYSVEYPYVFLGTFPKEYLKLPLEILSTAMKKGQNLFTIVKGKKQLPYFLGVTDANRDVKTLIRKGNERVLIARLEDAKFFWEQDLKISLEKRAGALSEVIFQEKLGSYKDKTQRLNKITAYLSDKIDDFDIKKELIQASELCKVDLLTEMVREFPSLQGRVGGLYSKEEGYPASIWRSVYEHYQPVGLDDEPPSTLGGALLSIADKIDSIMGAVGIGVEVTGSKDPFGLRRNAHGVCKVIIDKKLSFSFPRLLDKILKVYGDKLTRPKQEIKDYCLDFFLNRLQHIFENQGYRYDLVKAALQAGIDNIYYSFLRIKALDALKSSPNFEPLIIIAKRVNNIIQNQPVYTLNPGLLREKEERELHTTFCIIKENVLPMISRGEFMQTQRMILKVRSSINNFFDHVLVMEEDRRIRRNRLALLQQISKLLFEMADYSQVVIEGQDR
jgi:glycyl-tRNA synthetase beta chain